MRKVFIFTLFLYPIFGFCQNVSTNETIFIGEKISLERFIDSTFLSSVTTLNEKGDTISHTTYKSQSKGKYEIIVNNKGDTIDNSGSVSGSLDSKYIARYKVLQTISGRLEADTVSFIVYDHYGTPDFAKYQNVLLFLVEYGDEPNIFYHKKYAFTDVYKTKSGKWATPYLACLIKGINSNQRLGKKIDIEPAIMGFEEEVIYDKYRRGTTECSEFPEPYFEKINEGLFKAVYGYCIDDLFGIKPHK
ncbi:MAG TPA: bacterial Ig-like domain-containing protein [Sphingobacterium sp.]|nr:bacterial Ig-like domain-containing protein [Sphingobacterium sp.]